MEVYILIIGSLIIGTLLGYLVGSKKLNAAQADLKNAYQREELLKRTYEEALSRERQWQDRMKKEQLESEDLRKRMNTEFENLSNRIFQQKTEQFNRMSSEQINNLLRPLGDNLKSFRDKVEQIYSTESKERFSLEERIKELVELNNQLSEDANNLTRALKGDSKMQGDWGEMILERLLQASGLIEGEHYFRQEFLKDESGTTLTNEESGKQMQPDIIIRYPNDRDIIIDSKVSLTAYAAFTAAADAKEQQHYLKLHMQSVKKHIDELSQKDYSRYDVKSPDFVMMFIPTEGAYLQAIQTDNNLWEYAYQKKVVLMSPTNLISALHLSLDLWKRENQVKNVQNIIDRGTLLYEKIATFSDTLVSMGDKVEALHKEYDKAIRQFSEGPGNIVRQTEQLRNMSLTPKKRIPQKLISRSEDSENEASANND